MILTEHWVHHLNHFRFMQPRMLMLGNQQNVCGRKLPCEYETLDLDGGDHRIDLNFPLARDGSKAAPPSKELQLIGAFKTVYNLGTLEHVWDVNQAYTNAALMVQMGGYFIGHSPVAGYEGHGIHVTDWKRIKDFFTLNGFEMQSLYFTQQNGQIHGDPSRNCGKSVIMWFAAQKVAPFAYLKPQQVYKEGVKQ